MVQPIVGILIGLVIATTARADDVPFIGRWKLNSTRSEMTEYILTFTEVDQGQMKLVDATGETTFKFDGKDYPAQLGSTSAWKQIDPKTWESANKRDGKVTSTDTYTLSADGRTLTINTIREAKSSPEGVTAKRVSGGSGLAGKWRIQSFQADQLWEFSPNGADGLIIKFDDGVSCAAKFDGKDYAETGGLAPAGFTQTLRHTGARSFEMTQKQNGKVVVTNSFVLSKDGKTLTSTTVFGPSSPQPGKMKVVFERQ